MRQEERERERLKKRREESECVVLCYVVCFGVRFEKGGIVLNFLIFASVVLAVRRAVVL